MRLGLSILPAVLAISSAAPAGWAEPLRVSSLEARVNAAAGELRAARAKERATREEQGLLAHRIAALKRQDAEDALLERLLRDSIEADRALAAQIRDTRRWQQAVLHAVREAFEQIDTRLRELAPKLSERNELAVRRSAAREISQLRSLRKRLRRVLARVKDDERHREWADHVVKIDPLDGPSELADKGDVLALTQKKIDQKKQLLARLIREKQIAQAARDFTTDATALDEDLRTGRVSRRGDNETALAFDGPAEANTRAPEAPPDDTPQAGLQNEATDAFNGSAPPPDLDPARADNLGGQPQVGVPGPKSTVAVTPPPPPSPVAKQIDPNLLINLRIEELDADAFDLATLEKYVAELEAMQKALAAQARKIESRARQLERDEARTKSK